MKYKNFEEVKRLVAQIEKLADIISKLGSHYMDVQFRYDHKPFMTIGISSDCEHECAKYAAGFTLAVLTHYQQEVDKLHEQLAEL